ncbi:hypothetical protein SKAU_G00317500 [Synaphobranchus kaupii]|uniref:Uncharacterized protein n=1 Tax=Synaphobranchus kaupii TaxID=118154 RepID=A0A9Q1ESW3_SYNKA|nr:hypothetical protein SKAU_G00317500 [Synaphobranchus kaupii]
MSNAPCSQGHEVASQLAQRLSQTLAPASEPLRSVAQGKAVDAGDQRETRERRAPAAREPAPSAGRTRPCALAGGGGRCFAEDEERVPALSIPYLSTASSARRAPSVLQTTYSKSGAQFNEAQFARAVIRSDGR